MFARTHKLTTSNKEEKRKNENWKKKIDIYNESIPEKKNLLNQVTFIYFIPSYWL